MVSIANVVRVKLCRKCSLYPSYIYVVAAVSLLVVATDCVEEELKVFPAPYNPYIIAVIIARYVVTDDP